MEATFFFFFLVQLVGFSPEIQRISKERKYFRLFYQFV